MGALGVILRWLFWGILRDHRGVFLAAFGFFLSYQPILYAKLMVVCQGLELATQLGYLMVEVEHATQLGYPMVEVELDLAIVISWIHSWGPVRWVCSFT